MNNISKELQSIEEYFSYFEQCLNSVKENQDLKIVYPMFMNLRDEFKNVAISEKLTLFEKISLILELDAKLQLIVSWFGSLNWQQYFEENEIVSYIQEDIGCYYRELTGLSKNSQIPKGIIYLSEK